ncbi:acyl-CoA dehydrogenase [Pseudalgibacter alginicilyticus]|uniref:Acyl-CoA dehydrogenase n=1 Tax=Pseudalgibacter alginicilyticus TaxID=1736674 RepID=A0A0P0D9M0_9FLAO|nr:hypothetical protein [Pseudalgibacter alginicilyticus]ALJ05544.1 acyl-CoA dehydrogenase [Pseudalgibacter alginicilyticus]
MEVKKSSKQQLKELCLNQDILPKEVLDWVADENLWNLWIPKSHGGLEMSLSLGLRKLRSLAEIDGSLGWTVTLCSGANFFFGNLKKEFADTIFTNPKKPVCFGGSGGVFGTAEKKDDGYIISGTWKYATGAPYLTHFTLNAKLLENGKAIIDKNGAEIFRSFVVDKEDVEIIKDWHTMGLKATATHSFRVKEKWVSEKNSFIYNELEYDAPIFKVHFSVFADLTLWANYFGMAVHFYKESIQVLTKKTELNFLNLELEKSYEKINQFALNIEGKINSGISVPETWIKDIHEEASNSVKSMTEAIIKIYPLLGVQACSDPHILNHIFRDYFTATQHHIFTRN